MHNSVLLPVIFVVNVYQIMFIVVRYLSTASSYKAFHTAYRLMRLLNVFVDEGFVPEVKDTTSEYHCQLHCIPTANVDDFRFPFTVLHGKTAVGRSMSDTKNIRFLFFISHIVACAKYQIHTANTGSAGNSRGDAGYCTALCVRYVQVDPWAAAVRL